MNTLSHLLNLIFIKDIHNKYFFLSTFNNSKLDHCQRTSDYNIYNHTTILTSPRESSFIIKDDFPQLISSPLNPPIQY